MQQASRVLLLGGALALVVAVTIASAGGLDDLWALILGLCAVILLATVMLSGEESDSRVASTAGVVEKQYDPSSEAAGTMSSEDDSKLPDPLEDGFDLPLM